MTATELGTFIDASPSPFHVCATVARTLEADGFSRIEASRPWPTNPGRYFLIRGGSIIAWSTEAAPAGPFRIIGGHTDSPNLRVKQHPDFAANGWRQVALEPYGGPLLHTWLDRDLGLSGRLTIRDGDSFREQLVHIDEPILRVPNLAIHLTEDRKTLQLNPQRHLNAVASTGAQATSVLGYVADVANVDAADILGWELMTHDATPSRLVGVDNSMFSAPRLDNQVTCFAGMQALQSAAQQRGKSIPVLVLFDHEEVGSGSERGAQSDLLLTVLERISLAAKGSRDDFLSAMAASVCLSGDMAHATHPNYADRHEPQHQIVVNGGPVLKVNQNLRYATDAVGAATFALACDQAGVPMQRYVHRADLPCGSTIGPITAARTGLTTVDVGAPQLAMHSARELMGALDVEMYARALAAFLSGR